MRKILGGNCADLYGFDMKSLSGLAAKFGPTVAELEEPLTKLPDNPNEALLKSAAGTIV